MDRQFRPSMPRLPDLPTLSPAKIELAVNLSVAKTPARIRTPKGAEQRHRKLGDDEEMTRQRKSTANRVLSILKAALNRVWELRLDANGEYEVVLRDGAQLRLSRTYRDQLQKKLQRM